MRDVPLIDFPALVNIKNPPIDADELLLLLLSRMQMECSERHGTSAPDSFATNFSFCAQRGINPAFEGSREEEQEQDEELILVLLVLFDDDDDEVLVCLTIVTASWSINC